MSESSVSTMTEDDQRDNLSRTIVQALKIGNLSIVPPKNDGSKTPFPRKWTQYQKVHTTREELQELYNQNNFTGVGYVCGSISDNLECLVFYSRAIYDEFKAAAEMAGLLDVVERMEQGYMEYTPKGVQILYRCSEIGDSMRLASCPKLPEEMKHTDDKTKTIIAIQGERGWIIAAPSYGDVNPDGVYEYVYGGPDAIVTITPENRALVHGLARGLDIPPVVETMDESDPMPLKSNGTDTAGDDIDTGADIDTRADSISDDCAVVPHVDDLAVAAKDLVPKGLARKVADPIVSMNDMDWGSPWLFGNSNVPEVLASLLPCVFGEYADALSRSTQTPAGLAVMLMISTIATCLQGKFDVSPFSGYSEPLQIWTMTVLQSGSRKTTVEQKVTAPLTMRETAKYAELELQIKATRTRREFIALRMKVLLAKAGRAEDPDVRDGLLDEIDMEKMNMPPELYAPKLFTSDVTPAGLQKLLDENDGRMSIIADEAGIFKGTNGISSSGNIDVYLQGHAGSTIRVDRFDRTLTINDPSITFGLTAQVDVIKNLTRNGKDSLRGSGFLARYLFCVPDSIIGTRDVRSTYEVPDELTSRYSESVESLLDIPYLTAEDGGKRILGLDTEAREEWFDFAQYIENDQGPSGSLHSISDWGCKLAGATLRIAGLMHVAEFGITTDTISLGTMKNAIALSKILIDHAKVAFDMIGSDPVAEDAKVAFKWIISNGSGCFRRSELQHAMHGKFTKVDRLKAALLVLTERNIISEPVSKPTGRRPEIVYYVNPSVLVAA